MELNNESKTLFIPLLGKAIMSKDNLFLHDPKAEEIISKIDYDFNLLKQSKWLSMYMSVRALIIDELCNKYIKEHPNATIIHLGCGLDSRCLRVNQNFDTWYDIDYENVINIRKKFYEEDSKHKMIGSSVLDYKWLEKIKTNDNIMVVAEGLTMYLSEEEIKELVAQINNKLGMVDTLSTEMGTKQDKLTFDAKPTVNSSNPVTSGGVYTALEGKQPVGDYALSSEIPNVPDWAKAETKPVYTAKEVGAAEIEHTHDNYALKTDILSLDTTLSVEGKAADAKAVGDTLNNKLDNNFGTENVGKLLYVSTDGTIKSLSLGEGLEIVDGVLKLTGSVTPDTETKITVSTDDSGNLTILADGTEVEPTIDENGDLTYSGLGIVLDTNGNMTLKEETFH
mgnify:CR=1 FL=1